MTAQTEAAQMPWWKEPTKGQWISFLAAWVGWILDAFDFTIFMLAMPDIMKEFGVSSVAATWSITLTLLLRLVGGVVAGSMADRWGRKLPLMISVIWFAVCDGAVAFAPSFTAILVLRTLFGLGMGAEWTSGATLAMENWPERSRGIASGLLQGSWAVGYLLAGAAYGYVVPAFGWRALFIIAAVPALLVLPIRFWVPESPDWQKAAGQKKQSFKDLLGEGIVTRLVWASLVMAFGLGAYYGLTAMYPTMLTKQFGLQKQGVGNLVMLFNVGMMVGSILCGRLASKRGVAVAVAIPSLGVLPFLALYVGVVPSLLWLGAFIGGALGAACTGVTPLLLTSLFPAEIRGRCVGIVYHAGAVLAAFTPTTMAMLVERGGFSYAQSIALMAGVCEVGMVAALFLRPKAAQGEADVGSPAPALH